MDTYPKNEEKRKIRYECEKCLFITSKKYDYTKHLATDKHRILINTDEKSAKNEKIYNCDCGKKYKHSQSLYNHKKKCSFKEDEEKKCSAIVEKPQEIIDTKINYEKIIIELINQNKVMQEQQKAMHEHNKAMYEQQKAMQETIAELIPKVGNGNINIVNNNNNISNINLLNEKCKDALNINDFIKMIEVDVDDLIHTSKKGLTAGLSNLFLEHYNNLPLLERPLWCVDKKRKKLLIKDGEWQEDKDQKKTKEAIKLLGSVQAKNTNKYTKVNPDWFDSDKKKELYMSIVKQTTDTVDDKLDKILNNLTETIQLTDDVKDKIQHE
jgi:hypothetical protein